MRLGFSLPIAGAWATPDALVSIARRAEQLGYAGAWVFQRLLYPSRPRNEYYGAPGQPWPPAFRSVLDPIVALTYAAAVTTSLRLGASVLIQPFHQPAVLARQLASLDVVSRGRLTVGLGIGWSLDEYDAVAAPRDRRGARAAEFIRCLKALWADGEAGFTGEFHRVPPGPFEPKPVQRPHPRLLVGGYSDGVFRRAAELADGYTGGNVPLAEMSTVIARLQEAADRAGRDPASLAVVCRGSYHVTGAPSSGPRRALWGTLDEILEDLARYAACGVTELFLDANFQPGGAALDRVLGEMEALAPRP